MILVVLLNIGGLVAVLMAAWTAYSTGLDINAVAIAAPIALTGLVLLGLAQVIHALVRTARASEATLEEIRHVRAAQEKITQVFDRLGQKK